MKRCPECRRDYYDDSLLYCLDDGERLLEGPVSSESNTAILQHEGSDTLLLENSGRPDSNPHGPISTSLSSISSRFRSIQAAGGILLVVALVAGAAAYKYWWTPPAPSASALPFQSMKIERVTANGNALQGVISPDAKQIVFVVEQDGKRSLYLRQVATATDVQITEPVAGVPFFSLSLSPDGNFLYYIANGPTIRNRILYRMPLIGGVAQKLIDDVGSPIGISPDGKQLAFVRSGAEESTIMIANIDGGGERAVSKRKGQTPYGSLFAGGVAWSKDGTKIVTVAEERDEAETRYRTIIEVSIDDGTERPITSHRWYEIRRMAPLPDGSGLLMTAAENLSDLQAKQVWHLNYSDGEARRITNDLNDYGSMSLSADGRTLLSVQEDRAADIWIAPGGDQAAAVRIKSVSGKTDGSDGVDWMPDGRLVYHTKIAGNEAVWSMDADGKNRRQLTPPGATAYYPSVSTDGRFIVYVVETGGRRSAWRMNADGSDPRELVQPVGNNPLATSEFVIYRTRHALWKTPIDGGEPVLVSNENLTRCAISPDGKYVAGQLDVPGEKTTLGVVPVDGSAPIKVFHVSMDLPARIRWTPDGRAVTYVSVVDGLSDIWTQPVAGGEPKKLTNFRADEIFSFSWSPTNNLAISHGTSTSDVVLIRNIE